MPTQFVCFHLTQEQIRSSVTTEIIRKVQGWGIQNEAVQMWNCNRLKFFSQWGNNPTKMHFKILRHKIRRLYNNNICSIWDTCWPKLELLSFCMHILCFPTSEPLLTFSLNMTAFFFLDTKIVGVILCLVFFFYFFLTHNEDKENRGDGKMSYSNKTIEFPEEWKITKKNMKVREMS